MESNKGPKIPDLQFALYYFNMVEKTIKLSSKPEQINSGIKKALLKVLNSLGKRASPWGTPKTDADGRKIRVVGSFKYREKTLYKEADYPNFYRDSSRTSIVTGGIEKDTEKELCPFELIIYVNDVEYRYCIADFILLEQELPCQKQKKKSKRSSRKRSKESTIESLSKQTKEQLNELSLNSCNDTKK